MLEKVRGAAQKGASAYAADYKHMAALKQIADDSGVCLLAIHHTRKMRDDSDEFNMISGTNGIMGACDTIWVLNKERRADNEAKLCMTGRDIEQQEIVIRMDECARRWVAVGSAKEEGAYARDPVVRTVRQMMLERPEGFALTAAALFLEMRQRCGGYGVLSPRTLVPHLQKLSMPLWTNDSILYAPARAGNDRIHKFAKKPQLPQFGVEVAEVAEVAQVAGTQATPHFLPATSFAGQ